MSSFNGQPSKAQASSAAANRQRQHNVSSGSHNSFVHMQDDHDEDDHEQGDDEGAGKRRRVQRACDVCRKKKIRCDGLQPEKGACSNCATYGHKCTFIDAAKRRAPPRRYVFVSAALLCYMTIHCS